MYVYPPIVCLVPTKGTRSPGTKDLELLIVVSHHVGSGPRPSARTTTLLTVESSFQPTKLVFSPTIHNSKRL